MSEHHAIYAHGGVQGVKRLKRRNSRRVIALCSKRKLFSGRKNMGVAIADASQAEWFEVGWYRKRWLHGSV